MPTRGDEGWPSLWRRAAPAVELFGLTGLVVTQPVLDCSRALFALALPAVLVLERSVLTGAAVAVGVGWAVVCVGWVRYENRPDPTVSDQRALLLADQRVIHPLTVGPAAEAMFDRGQRGVVPSLFHGWTRTSRSPSCRSCPPASTS